MDRKAILKPSIVLFFLGFAGILSIIPFIPQLLALQSQELSLSIGMIQAISIAQSSILLMVMIWLGSTFSRKVGLSAPVIFSLANSRSAARELKAQIAPAMVGGVSGGIFILLLSVTFSGLLPPEFLKAGEKIAPAWYTKILYGGITEEILVRWGLMSLLVWIAYRLTQKPKSKIRNHNYIIAITVSSLVFGLGHLPTAFALFPEATAPLLIYIVLTNAVFGFIAGYLYWKRGLECAIGAHIIAHITMILGASVAQ